MTQCQARPLPKEPQYRQGYLLLRTDRGKMDSEQNSGFLQKVMGFIYILSPFKEAQNSICRAEIEMQMQRKGLWTQWGNERVGQIERVALTYIHHHV